MKLAPPSPLTESVPSVDSVTVTAPDNIRRCSSVSKATFFDCRVMGISCLLDNHFELHEAESGVAAAVVEDVDLLAAIGDAGTGEHGDVGGSERVETVAHL